MSTAVVDQNISTWVSFLRRKACEEKNIIKSEAWSVIARETKVPAGTLENIERQRIKGVKWWVAEAIKRATIRCLEKEIMRLSHELQMVRQCGGDPRDFDFQEIEQTLAAVRRTLEGAK